MRFLAPIIFLASAAAAMAIPLAPTGLTATASGDKQVVLRWTNPSPGAGNETPTGNLVYRSLNSEDNFILITSGALSPTTTTYTDTDSTLVAGVAYKYAVRALAVVGGNEVLSPQSNIATATPLDLPDAPGNLRTTRVTSSSVSLAWNAVIGASSYIVYRDEEEVREVTGTTLTDVNLEKGTEYTYTVTAVNEDGESADSSPLTVTTGGDGSGKEPYYAKKFRTMDTDGDGLLTLEEYARKQAARQAWVIAAHRYEYMDYDSSGDVTLSEFAKALGGRKFFAPSKPRKFLLADEDLSGDLDVSEFSLTVNSKLKPAKVQKMFDKRNKDDSDDVLTEEEFGIKGPRVVD